eukprot:m.771705 g.771705  ORF g.771705 m.771705 type:complete len:1102 (+) comp23245_c0_seq1:58-3363(+)
MSNEEELSEEDLDENPYADEADEPMMGDEDDESDSDDEDFDSSEMKKKSSGKDDDEEEEDDIDGDDDDDDNDDDDDDDDDMEDDAEVPRRSTKRKAQPGEKPKRKRALTAEYFMDNTVEEVAADEEEDVAEASEQELERMEREALAARERRQRELEDRRKEMEAMSDDDDDDYTQRGFDNRRTKYEVNRDLEDFNKREKARRQREKEDSAAMGDIFDGKDTEFDEQRLLPTWRDPKIWSVQCMVGKEQEVCVQLMRRFFERQMTDKPLEIKSVVANPAPRSSMGRSYVYIEAFKLGHVQDAIAGIENLRYGRYKQDMIKVEERPNILHVVRPRRVIKKMDWVRLRSQDYRGDVARVIAVNETEDTLELQVIPRIDFAKYTAAAADSAGKQKKKRSKVRPPQRLFDVEDLGDHDLKHMFEHDTYEEVYKFDNKKFRDGFMLQTLKTNRVDFDNVKPTLAELRIFESSATDDISSTPDALPTRNPFKKGDKVEVREGDLINLLGTVLSIEGHMVTMQPHHEDLHDPISFEYGHLAKAFKSSDHVKVTDGHYSGETGLVVKIDNDVIHVVSDLTLKEIKVKASDLQLASDVASGMDSLGQFGLHDLVQLDPRTVACVVRIERDMLFVVDQDGNDKQVKPIAVQPLRNRRDGSAVDCDRNEIRKKTIVKVLEGPCKGRRGAVLHVHRSSLFIYQREILENNGVYVVRSRHVKVAGGGGAALRGGMSQQSRGNIVPESPRIHGGPDTGRGNAGRGRGSGGRGRGGRQRRSELINKTVRVINGPYKGAMGSVKDATDVTARVELHAVPKTKIFQLTQLRVINETGTGYYPTGSLMFQGAQTPKYGSATPAYGSATPAYGGLAGNATPRYGGATPAHDSSATPSTTWDAGTPAMGTPGNYDGDTPSEYPGTGNSDLNSDADFGTPATNGAPTPATYDYTAPTPRNAYQGSTPAAMTTPSDSYVGYSEYDGSAMTPANAYTPGSGSPSVAYTPGQDPGTPASGAGTWHAAGVRVATVDGREGTIVFVDGNACTVKYAGGGTTEFQKQDLTVVQPSQRGERIIVLQGEHKGWKGKVLTFEGQEVVAELVGDSGQLVRILQKDMLAIHDDV